MLFLAPSFTHGVRRPDIPTVRSRLHAGPVYVAIALTTAVAGCDDTSPSDGTRTPPPSVDAGLDASALPDLGVGNACGSDDDCGDLVCLLALSLLGETVDLDGGYCSDTCGADADCGDRGLCLGAALGGSGICTRACDRDDDCRGSEGYVCAAPSTGAQTLADRVCLPPLPQASASMDAAPPQAPGGDAGADAS